MTTPTATIPKIPIDPMNILQNLKSVALPVHEIIGDTQKIWAAPGYACDHNPSTLQTDGQTDGQTDNLSWQYRATLRFAR